MKDFGTGILRASDSQSAYADGPALSNPQTGTSYTLVLADANKIVPMNNASANTLTVPPNSSVAYPLLTRITVPQRGAGQTTIAPGSGVTLNSRNSYLKLSGRYAYATLIKYATDEWDVVGDLVP